MSSTLKLRRIQVGKDPSASNNFTLGSVGQGVFGITVGDLNNDVATPITFTSSDVTLIDAKSKDAVALSDNSRRFATTEWTNSLFGSSDVYADYTTTDDILLSGLGIQEGGDWDEPLDTSKVVLVTKQKIKANNGWYNPRAGAWVRIDTKNQSNKLSNSVITRISRGKTLSGSIWMLSTIISGSFVLGTTGLDFINISNNKGIGRPIDIIKVSKQGHNSILFLTSDGVLYEAHGNGSNFSNFNSGRGAVNTALIFGVPNANPVNIPSSSKVIDFVMLFGSSYALLANGELWVWGYNTSGELGLGHNTNVNRPVLSTTNVSRIFENSCLGVAQYNTMFIQKTDGYVYATGYNGYGQLGLNNTVGVSVWTRLDHIGTNPVGVWPMGGYCTLFYQKSDLSIFACGYNGWGQIGDGTTNQRNLPVDVTSAWRLNSAMVIKKIVGGNGWTILNNSSNSVCTTIMMLDDGFTTDIRTCGFNGNGQIGDGSTVNKTVPVRITSIGSGRVKDIDTNADGVTSVLLLKEDGSLWVWGFNGFGQLGNGTTANILTPAKVLDNVRQLVMGHWKYSHGSYQSSYVIKDDGLYSTGYNANGEGGWGDDNANKSLWTRCNLPIDLKGNQIKLMGSFTTTANGIVLSLITTDNVVWSWGHNGQYGVSYNNPANVNAPTITTIFRGH